VRDEQRDAGNGPDLAVDVADREDREGEGSGEEADRQLAWTVARQRSHDPRRELAHRELHGHGGQRAPGRRMNRAGLDG
jgi:hypothetical protein